MSDPRQALTQGQISLLAILLIFAVPFLIMLAFALAGFFSM
jgi:hypothetical protein